MVIISWVSTRFTGNLKIHRMECNIRKCSAFKNNFLPRFHFLKLYPQIKLHYYWKLITHYSLLEIAVIVIDVLLAVVANVQIVLTIILREKPGRIDTFLHRTNFRAITFVAPMLNEDEKDTWKRRTFRGKKKEK